MYFAPETGSAAEGEQEGAGELCRGLAARLNLPAALVAVLWRRGYRDEERIRAFLHPNLADLPDPDLLLGMGSAVELLTSALGSSQPIVIYADYDADGLTAGALLYTFLQAQGHRQLHYLLPHRLEDGYGVHAHLLAELLRQLPTAARPLLLTVDCGISDHQAIAAANDLGFTVIVTDHHRPPPQLPPAAAILNPHQPGCPFPCKNLAGVGVAFYLLMGLRRHLAREGFWAAGTQPNLKEYLDLVALGTVADMVPLRGVNRILVRAGLEVLQATTRPGLAALAEIAGIPAGLKGTKGQGRALCSEDISFALAPRLNAAGRVAAPETAFRLLITDDEGEAAALAAELEKLNRWRRELSENIYLDVRRQAGQAERQDLNILIYSDPSWHPGVLGIAASRLVRDFDRPVILLGEEEGIIKGSGRSIEGLDLLAAVGNCEELLLGYGGHAAALGLSLQKDKLELFRRQLDRETGQRLATMPAREALSIDWSFPEGRIDRYLTSIYHLLEPFGSGNPEPIFQVRGRLARPTLAGRNHLRFHWQQPDLCLPGIAFDYGAIDPELSSRTVELIFTLRRNFYQGQVSWQLQSKSVSTIT